MAIFLYRKRGGEVTSASLDADAYAKVDPAFWGTVVDPPLPDGDDLGIPKIFDNGIVRNATPEEMGNFEPAQRADQVLLDRASAQKLFSEHPVLRKVFAALMREMSSGPSAQARNFEEIKKAVLDRIGDED